MRHSRAEVVERLKITMQYRTKQGMAYELRIGEAVLALCISPPPDPPATGRWHVEARLGSAPGPVIADGWGPTPGDALKEAALGWCQSPCPAAFDWEAVTRELHGVRAV